MDELMRTLMNHRYWDILRLTRGGNEHIRRFATEGSGHQARFLQLVMLGFYPLSIAVLLAWRQMVELAPTAEIRATAKFFVEVEEGKHARAEWYQGVPHLELYRRLFTSFISMVLIGGEGLSHRYLTALNLPQGGFARSLVAAAFIEKTGLQVLHLLHDFVAQWQVLVGVPTSAVDLTYLNEHLLLERSDSADQHVPLVDGLLSQVPGICLVDELHHFEEVTTDHWNAVVHHINNFVSAASVF